MNNRIFTQLEITRLLGENKAEVADLCINCNQRGSVQTEEALKSALEQGSAGAFYIKSDTENRLTIAYAVLNDDPSIELCQIKEVQFNKNKGQWQSMGDTTVSLGEQLRSFRDVREKAETVEMHRRSEKKHAEFGSLEELRRYNLAHPISNNLTTTNTTTLINSALERENRYAKLPATLLPKEEAEKPPTLKRGVARLSLEVAQVTSEENLRGYLTENNVKIGDEKMQLAISNSREANNHLDKLPTNSWIIRSSTNYPDAFILSVKVNDFQKMHTIFEKKGNDFIIRAPDEDNYPKKEGSAPKEYPLTPENKANNLADSIKNMQKKEQLGNTNVEKATTPKMGSH